MLKTVELLERKLGGSKHSGGYEYAFCCPNHVDGDPKRHLYVNVQSGRYICFRCRSRFKGSVDFLFRKLKLGPLPDEGFLVKTDQRQFAVMELPAWFVQAKHADRALYYDELNYLKQRAGKFWKEPVFYVSTNTVIAVDSPIFRHWWSRDVSTKFFNMPTRHMVPVYFCNRCEYAQRVVVTEGPFDAVAWWQIGLAAVALIGTDISDYQLEQMNDTLHKNVELCVALDPDATTQAINLAKQLRGIRPKVSLITLPKDADELTTDERKMAFQNRSEVSIFSCLKHKIFLDKHTRIC